MIICIKYIYLYLSFSNILLETICLNETYFHFIDNEFFQGYITFMGLIKIIIYRTFKYFY